jgi:hypothetical protein
MKKEHIKELFEKYKKGETSLEEEKFLLENSSELNFPLANWINMERENKNVPENLNEKLWASFEKRTPSKNKIMLRVLVAAASIVLLFSLYPKNYQDDTQSLIEKQALLMEAKSMFTEIEQNTNQEIIFENDLIVLYTKN